MQVGGLGVKSRARLMTVHDNLADNGLWCVNTDLAFIEVNEKRLTHESLAQDRVAIMTKGCQRSSVLYLQMTLRDENAECHFLICQTKPKTLSDASSEQQRRRFVW